MGGGRWWGLAVALVLMIPVGAGAGSAAPPVYSEIIPTASGLAYQPGRDEREDFVATDGRVVEVLVRGPIGDGVYSRAIRPGETPDAYFPAVVQEAVAAGAHRLIIPRARYDFQGPALCEDLASAACQAPTACSAAQYYNCAPHWTIGTYPSNPVLDPASITDLDIDLSGSVLNFKAPVIGLWILEAQRLRLRNFTIDWPALPIASLGRIVADPANPGHNALVIDSAYPVVDKFYGGRVQIQAVDPWDDSATDPPGRFDANANNSFETYFIFGNAPQPSYLGRTSAGAQTFSCKSCAFQNGPDDPSCSFFQGCANFDGFAVGARVIVRHYTYNGFALYVSWSDDIDLENVLVRTGPGMGIAVGNNGGGRGFRLHRSAVRRGPGRIISSASDAVNLGLQADIILDDNDIADQGDDGLNIHPTTLALSAVDGAKVQLAGVCDPDPRDSPYAGDALAFFDTNFTYLATARVESVTGYACGTLTVTLDRTIPGLTASGQIVDLSQQASARYIVRGNRFHDNRGHGILVNAPYGRIAGNSFAHDSAGAIASAGGNGNGPGATLLTVAGNRIASPGQLAQDGGAISFIATTADGTITVAPLFQKVAFLRNVFDDLPGPALVVTSARTLRLARTVVADGNRNDSAPQAYGSVSSTDSIVLYRTDDAVICGFRRFGATTGPIGIDAADRGIRVRSACP